MGPAPKVHYSVEFDEGALKLRVTVGERSIPIAIAPEQAAILATALISGSVVGGNPEEGSFPNGTVEHRSLPVTHWRTGVIKERRVAVLIVDLVGGGQLALQFSPSLAVSCGQSLFEAGQTLAFGDW